MRYDKAIRNGRVEQLATLRLLADLRAEGLTEAELEVVRERKRAETYRRKAEAQLARRKARRLARIAAGTEPSVLEREARRRAKPPPELVTMPDGEARIKVVGFSGVVKYALPDCPLATDPSQRCTRIKKDGTQCRKIRMRGATCCRDHGGGRERRAHLAVDERGSRYRRRRNKERLGDMDRRYKRLAPALDEFVGEALNKSHAQQLRLYEELALMQSHASQAVAMYSVTTALPDTVVNKHEMVLAAGEMMKTQLFAVADMAGRAAAVEAVLRDKISPDSLAGAVDQIVRIARETLTEHLGEDDERAVCEAFEKNIRGGVRVMMDAGLAGRDAATDLTPGGVTAESVVEDVLAMDDTVPSVNE